MNDGGWKQGGWVRPVLALLLWSVSSLAALAEPAPDAELVAQFQRVCAQRAAEADKADTMTVVGEGGWLFLGKELRHVSAGKFWGPEAVRVSRAAKPDQADPLPAIVDFHEQLKRAGIELLLVPVPPKAIVFADQILPAAAQGGAAPPRLDPDLQAFYRQLAEQGVKVLDLTDDFLAHRTDNDQPLYCRQDSHWSGAGCVLAAERIARALEKSGASAGGSPAHHRQRAPQRGNCRRLAPSGGRRETAGRNDRAPVRGQSYARYAAGTRADQSRGAAGR